VKIPFIPYVQGRNDYTDGDGFKYGIAVHNTSNDASDTGEASYATRRTDGISSHLYGDADSVTQSLDTDDRAGHAGSAEGNGNAIAWEFTGANGKSREWWLANINWPLVGRVNAAIIRHHWPDGSFQVRRATVAEMKANPKVKAFYGHDDMRRAWGGTTHTDPGPNFPWDKLFDVTNAALKGIAVTEVEFNQDDRNTLTADTWRTFGMASMTPVIEYKLPDEPVKRSEPNLLAAAINRAVTAAETGAKTAARLEERAGLDAAAVARELAVLLGPELAAAAREGAKEALAKALTGALAALEADR